jgi:hypothetical protein
MIMSYQGYHEALESQKQTEDEITDLKETPPVVTTDFLYVRFIGDRSIQEKDFGRIQKIELLRCKSGLKISTAYEPCNRSSEQSLRWIWTWYREYI